MTIDDITKVLAIYLKTVFMFCTKELKIFSTTPMHLLSSVWIWITSIQFTLGTNSSV